MLTLFRAVNNRNKTEGFERNSFLGSVYVWVWRLCVGSKTVIMRLKC